mmetsp:Transcript_2885/g.3074  ORF Transcript_2885/g.3074 Transcript_2885/m.3074 type:complete len:95 (-) Transcript_2885:976-1260(-)
MVDQYFSALVVSLLLLVPTESQIMKMTDSTISKPINVSSMEAIDYIPFAILIIALIAFGGFIHSWYKCRQEKFRRLRQNAYSDSDSDDEESKHR